MKRGQYFRTKSTRERLSKSMKEALANPDVRRRMADAKNLVGTLPTLQEAFEEAAELYIQWDADIFMKNAPDPIRWDWSGWKCLPVIGSDESCCNMEEEWIAIPLGEGSQMIPLLCQEIAHVLAGTYRHNLAYVKKLSWIAMEAKQQYGWNGSGLETVPEGLLRHMEECLVLDESKGYWKNEGTKKGSGVVVHPEYVRGRGTKEPTYRAKTYQDFHSHFQIKTVRRLSFPPGGLFNWEDICKEFNVDESTRNKF